MNQLESALVLVLRDTLNWESTVVDDSGTLTPVNPSAPLDVTLYQRRDRVLAYRDMVVGAAVVEVAVQVGDVWNYTVPKPVLDGPAIGTLPFNGTEAGQVNSLLRHVTNVSVPVDAAQYADADLYGRDALVYEILARACQATFAQPVITPVDATGTVIPGTAVWSLGEGAPGAADINAALPLNRDLFKLPDTNLADRDNQLAGYAAQLAQVLKNPFNRALRLYVQITSSGTLQAEPDVFALVSDDGVNRVFQAEPALPGANQIIYNVPHQTLQWLDLDPDSVHVPQLCALVVPGITASQFVQTLAQMPERRDAQYWRAKAGQLNPAGVMVTDTDIALATTRDNLNITGGVMQAGSISFTVPDVINFTLNGTLPAGGVRVNALAKPNSTVEIAGVYNQSNTSGTLGGATFEVNVFSGYIGNKQYLVQGGDGVVYNGNTYLPGETFTGTTTAPTYMQVGGTPSTIRQYALEYQLALPPGQWSVTIDYTNLSGATDGFALLAAYIAAGKDSVNVMQDIAPVPFNGNYGDIMVTPVAGLTVTDSTPFRFPVYWTGGDGQLHLRRLTFQGAETTGHYAITASFAGSLAQVDALGVDKVPGVLRWDFYSYGSYAGATPLSLNFTADGGLPLQLQQVQVQALGFYDTTPLSSGFQGWRQECLERAGRVIDQNYNRAVLDYGTLVPTFRDSGSYWSPAASENWMSFVEVYNHRLREVDNVQPDSTVPFYPFPGHQYVVAGLTGGTYNGTLYGPGNTFYGITGAGTYAGDTLNQVGAFQKSRPGHLGRPALVPRGLYFDDTTKQAVAYFDTSMSTPRLLACQPWMIEQGLYVAQPEFWMPECLNVDLLGVATALPGAPPVPPAPGPPPSPPVYETISVTVHPPGAASVSGPGSYLLGSSVLLTALPALKVVNGYADIVFLVDESTSMGSELGSTAAFRTWVGTLANELESALNAAGIGRSQPNQYAMIGFGGLRQMATGGRPTYETSWPHIFNVGGNGVDWGSAAALATAANGLTNIGSTVDGYTAMDFALHAYTYRALAAKLFVLLTDKNRDDIITGIPSGSSSGVFLVPGTILTNGTNSYTTPSDVTIASITSALAAKNVILATCNLINMTASPAGTVIGASGTNTGSSPAFLVSATGPSYYTTSVLASLTSGDGVGFYHSDNAYKNIPSCYYWNVAQALPGGTFWDLTNLSVPANLTSFTSCLVAQIKDSILTNLSYTFEYWTVNSGTYATNPVGITVAGTNAIDVYLA